VFQEADGRTLMLNGTWTMDPLHAGSWNYAASVVYRRPLDTDFRISCSIVIKEHDSHHISLPPFNPLGILDAPAEDEDSDEVQMLPGIAAHGEERRAIGLSDPCRFCGDYSIVVEEHDSYHIPLPPLNPPAIVHAPEDEDMLTRSLLPFQ